MKLCRFRPRAEETGNAIPRCGILRGEVVDEIEGAIYGSRKNTGRTWPLSELHLLAPVSPSKIICVGRNYPEHARELGNPVPQEPVLFLKPPTAVIGPGDLIRLPRISARVDYEGELAAVIGRICSTLPPEESAAPFIAGYTCLNDVTARDLQKKDVAQFTRSKSFDTFCPLGPMLATEFDFENGMLETRVNGERRQQAYPRDMLFSVDAIICWVTQVMTLLPGDVLALGTPPGVGPLHPGDLVEVEATGIGRLENRVAAPPG